ncbi:MAG: molecular chaperone DnaJ [Crocosphaera sp.]|nr:molecular chaperone DnaJ [Crocosphaera sp.]
MGQNPLPTNPYDILEVSPSASNAEITKAFAMAMKRRQYPVDAIAKARKTLMNPQERIMADFLCPIISSIERFKKHDMIGEEVSDIKLDLLKKFDPQENESLAISQGDEVDKKLGQLLFSESAITQPYSTP